MFLLIDNYDSFTYNLYQYLGEITPDIRVVRNDAVSVEDIKQLNPQGIILSPGPGRPENAGICIETIKEFTGRIPILGICLGHQAIGHAYGGDIVEAGQIMHGKTSLIKNNGKDLFQGMDNCLEVMRYHSLVVDKKTIPEELEVTAETEDGVVMGIKHKNYPVFGLQFHPESILTEAGKRMLKNYTEVFCNAK